MSKAQAQKKPLLLISTKTGDQGQSGLANGQRLAKSSQIFEVIGTLDELNSWLGLCIAILKNSSNLCEDKIIKKEIKLLLNIQQQLFVVGAEVAGAAKTKLAATELKKIERAAESLQTKMSKGWHSKFVLPGGTIAGAQLDLARTVCRRTERELVTLGETVNLNSILLQYLNRLSDYLYVLRCFVNLKSEHQEEYFYSS